MSTIWNAKVKMFCGPHTPPYHALRMPVAVAPRTSSATSATTMRVRMTANKYGSGMRRSTYRTHNAVRPWMTPRRSTRRPRVVAIDFLRLFVAVVSSLTRLNPALGNPSQIADR
jgi:hypothetical protein